MEAKKVLLHCLGGGRGDRIGLNGFVLEVPETSLNQRTLIGIDAGAEIRNERLYLPSRRVLSRFAHRPLDAIICTHPHEDHIGGLLPMLRYLKPNAPICVSYQTAAMIPQMFMDGMNFHPDIYQKLGGLNTVTEILERLRIISPGENELVPGIKWFADPRGHVPGNFSPTVKIEAIRKNIEFLSDNCFHSQYLIRGGKLISECLDDPANPLTKEWIPDGLASLDLTNSSVERKDLALEEEKLFDIICETVKRGGKVVVPSFRYVRGPQLALVIRDAVKSGRIPNIRIFVDGNFQRVYDILKHGWSPLDVTDFSTEGIIFIGKNRALREEITTSDEPAVILATGGMGNGVFKLYAEKLAADPKSSFVSVSYQADDSLVKKMIEASKNFRTVEFWIDERDMEEVRPRRVEVKVLARVESLSMTAHTSLGETQMFLYDMVKVRGFRKLDFITAAHGTDGTKQKIMDPTDDMNLSQFSEECFWARPRKTFTLYTIRGKEMLAA